MVVDVDVAAEADELRERSAHRRVLDDLIKGYVVFTNLGNVPVRVNVRVVDVLSVTLPRCASVAVVVDALDELRAPEHVGGNVVVWVVVDFDRKGAVVGDAAGGYGDELADCEYAEQRTVLVTFLLEAAQLFRAGARVVLDLVEGGHGGSVLLCVGFVFWLHCITCWRVVRAENPGPVQSLGPGFLLARVLELEGCVDDEGRVPCWCGRVLRGVCVLWGVVACGRFFRFGGCLALWFFWLFPGR